MNNTEFGARLLLVMIGGFMVMVVSMYAVEWGFSAWQRVGIGIVTILFMASSLAKHFPVVKKKTPPNNNTPAI